SVPHGTTKARRSPPKASQLCARNWPLEPSPIPSRTSSLFPQMRIFPGALRHRLPLAVRLHPERILPSRRIRLTSRGKCLGQQLRHVFRRPGGKIVEWVTTTGARCNDTRIRSAFANLLNQRSRDLERQVVLGCEHAERARHSAATSVEQSCFATG